MNISTGKSIKLPRKKETLLITKRFNNGLIEQIIPEMFTAKLILHKMDTISQFSNIDCIKEEGKHTLSQVVLQAIK